MDHDKLAELLFPHISMNPAEYEFVYPERKLPAGAKVTRLGPSPTGFIHLGNLYGAFVDERLAHQSGGIFYLRIEDTDDKRQVEGAVEAIISSLAFFGVNFDEGASMDREKGDYGPYYQRQRAKIYQTYVKQMVQRGAGLPLLLHGGRAEHDPRRTGTAEREPRLLRQMGKAQGPDSGRSPRPAGSGPALRGQAPVPGRTGRPGK